MKKIEAIIQPHKLDEVKDALKAIGVDGMTISEVRGHGRQKGHTETYRGAEYTVDLLPKVKLEMVVANARVEEILTALSAAAKIGQDRRWKDLRVTVEETIRIRNGDRGESRAVACGQRRPDASTFERSWYRMVGLDAIIALDSGNHTTKPGIAAAGARLDPLRGYGNFAPER